MADVAVRFGRLEKRGLLLGLSAAQVALCAVAVGVVVLAEYAAGVPGVVAAAPLWAVLLVVAILPVQGRPLVDWLPVWSGWMLRARQGRVRQVVGTPATAMSPSPGDVALTVPGARGLSLIQHAAGVGLVFDRSEGTLTGIVRVGGQGFLLRDPDSQGALVAGWGQVLAGLCHQPQVVRVQILTRTVADSAEPLRRWWSGESEDCWQALIASEIVDQLQSEARRVETLIAVAVRPKRLTRRPSRRALDDATQILTGVSESLSAAGLVSSPWLDPAGVAHALRVSFDPQSPASRSSEAQQLGTGVAAMGMQETWSTVGFDSGQHAVYWVSEWPRQEVTASFLQPILLGGRARRSLSLTVTPVPAGRALREIRRAKVEQAADAAARVRTGRIEDEATRAEVADLARRESDLVAGHGDMRFVGILTVTADDAEELESACIATDGAAAQAMCEVRRLVGQQAAGFVAGAVPLARRMS